MPQLARPGFAYGFLLLLVAASTSLSCGRSESLSPVEGKVLYQNAPLAGALVSFHPLGEGSDTRERSVGRTEDDGTFRLNTGETEGAPAGDYIVTVICPVPVQTETKGMSMGGDAETEDRLRGAYANPRTSEIKITIKEGENQLEPIELR
jgi:hypothetical protein